MSKLAIAAAAAALFSVYSSTIAKADACSDLVDMAQKGLSMQGLDTETKSQLEQLLDAGKSGDLSRCDQATGSIFQSSPEGERAPTGHRCSKTPETV
jgi:hypothetical protein